MSLDYRIIASFHGHNDCVIRYLKFSPDGNWLISIAQDSSICLWNVKALLYSQPIQPTYSFQSPQGLVTSVAWCSNNSDFLTGGEDHTIRLWSIIDGNRIEERLMMKGHDASVTCLATKISIVLSIASGGQDGSLRIWNTEGESRPLPMVHKGPVTTMDFSPFASKALLISGGYDGSINLFDINTGQCLQSWFENDYMNRIYPPISSIRFSPNGRFILVSSMDNVIRLFELPTHRCKRIYVGHRNQEMGHPEDSSIIHTINCGIITKGSGSRDFCYVVSGSQDGNVWIWNLQNKKIVQVLSFLSTEEMEQLKQHYQPTQLFQDSLHICTWSIDFHPILKCIVAGGNIDGTIKIWKSESMIQDDSDLLSNALLELSVT